MRSDRPDNNKTNKSAVHQRRSGIKIMLQLIVLIRPLLHIMTGAVVLGIIGYLCAIFIPVFGVYGIISALGLADGPGSGVLIAVLLILAVLRGGLRYAEQWCNHFIAFKLLALIRHKVFDALRNLAPAKLEEKEKGNLISIITSDIELLEVFYAHTISPIMIGFFTSVLMLIFLGSQHPYFALITGAGYLIVGVILPLAVGRMGSDTGMQYRNEFGELNSHFLDSLRGIRECIQYDHGRERMDEMLQQTDRLDVMQKKLKNGEGITRAVTGLIIMLTGLGVLVTGIGLLDAGTIGFDAVLIATVAAISSFGPVTALSNLSNNLVHTLASGERVLALLEEVPVVAEVTGQEPAEAGDLECQNVDFAYDEEPILTNCSLQIRAGQITGIHGKSGSGKSTLLKLLMRFWETDGGKVTVGGREIGTINTSDLRRMEAYMTQDTYLFHSTIRENISISKPDATIEEIQEAAELASVHDYIMTLPEGYDTKVSELGESLSGGEKQRIGLARAFLHNAEVLLLDEPTSNLDSLNEAVILKSLKDTCKGKAVVLVSHRKSTMHIADQIYRMETGRVS